MDRVHHYSGGSRRYWVVAILIAGSIFVAHSPARSQPPGRGEVAEVSGVTVRDRIDRGKRWMLKMQSADGAFRGNDKTHEVGLTSLGILALVNCGMTAKDAPVQKALRFLRSAPSPHTVYEVSLALMALATAKDGQTDFARMQILVQELEASQCLNGPNAGLWDYQTGRPAMSGDRSNGQFAVLGLREAQEAGVPVSLEVWKRIHQHWKEGQKGGGWGYRAEMAPWGSMTAAGIATMVITEAMVRFPDELQDKIDCCAELPSDRAIEDGVRWLARRYSLKSNPEGPDNWWAYYIYGIERAGRLSGRRFFGKHDWYRDGAALVVRYQQADGHWEQGTAEANMYSTAFCLLFLSKGLSGVLINKLEYGATDNTGEVQSRDWNHSRDDARNLTQFISGQDRWPKLITWQVLEHPRATLEEFLQAPVLLITGTESFAFSDAQIALLREYVLQGGFIFAEAGCQSDDFDSSFREMIERMYPDGDSELKKLTADHPIFRAEHLIDPGPDGQYMELFGVDVGCRTGIVYSKKNNLCCLWDHWTSFPLPKRSLATTERVTKGMQMGVNIVAYATGREVPDKLDPKELKSTAGQQDLIQRGLIQIAKIRYTGDWNPAPQSVRNLLLALNQQLGPVASTKQESLLAQDAAIFNFPLLYLHGRNNFALTQKERDNLQMYLERGNVLIADACCSAPQFDKAFRQLLEQMFPGQLKRIPPDHAVFSQGFNLQRIKRREPDSSGGTLKVITREAEPYLEGIEINGRFVVLYSRYDISCALEKQSSVACTGYLHEDAVKLAISMVRYALLQ